MAFYDPMLLEVHVLLVEQDMNVLETAKMLQSNSYKVTAVQEVPVASSMLLEGDTKFDLLMFDLGPSDQQGYNLVIDAINMGLIVILISANANAILAKSALEDGAFLFMEKPIAAEELKYLWQHVLREKVRKTKFDMRGGEQWENAYSSEGMSIDLNASKNKVTSQKGRVEYINFDASDNLASRCMRPKMCTEWTPELHEKFVDAVRQLGEGRCFPKEILEIMNVPGLTRMQVASHLQKCRYGWRHHPHAKQTRGPKASNASNSKPQRSKTKRYGIVPRLFKGSQPSESPHLENNQQVEQIPSATSDNTDYFPPSYATQNMGQQGIYEANVSNNGNMDEISFENVLGDVVAAPEQGLQTDISFDFAVADDSLIANNYGLQLFNYDYGAYAGQTSDASETDTGFWNSWIANFSRDY